MTSLSRSALLDDLVATNHILAGLGVLDGFGQVSVRDPERADAYLMSRALAPELVGADDIMSFDLASVPEGGDARTPYLERFIHGEIYARRADVQAIVHSHAPGVVPFAASSVPLRPIYHMGAFLGTGVPVFEIRERFGMTDMLVRNRAQGQALADALGDCTGWRRHLPRRRRSEAGRCDQPQRDRATLDAMEAALSRKAGWLIVRNGWELPLPRTPAPR
ncbi:MAG: class II aldolase/adducin family protein [Casimicrobiaceae bacterium]